MLCSVSTPHLLLWPHTTHLGLEAHQGHQVGVTGDRGHMDEAEREGLFCCQLFSNTTLITHTWTTPWLELPTAMLHWRQRSRQAQEKSVESYLHINGRMMKPQGNTALCIR